MRKIAILVAAALMLALAGCTSNTMSRQYGGSTTINLRPGERLLEVTWKEDNLWLLTEPMDSEYVPKTKTFREDSRFGCLEGEVTIIETR